MNAVELRAAVAGDAPAIAAIYAHYVECSVATFDTSRCRIDIVLMQRAIASRR